MFFSRARVLLTFRDVSLLRDRGLSCFSCVLTLLVSYANAVSPANDDVSTSPRTYLHTHLRMRSMYKVSIWIYMNIHRFPHVLNITCKLHGIHVMSMGLTCKELVGARFQLYRSQILQVNMRWKALAEIYTMHAFAQLCNLKFCKKLHFVQNYEIQ